MAAKRPTATTKDFFESLRQLYTAVSRKFNLSEKVHATIPKGIVGGFHFPVFKTKFKEWQERPRTYVCEG